MSAATLKVWNYCMNSCEYCVSRSNSEYWKPENFITSKNVLDIPSALHWLELYRPNSEIHLSGGEPLLRPDIDDVVRQCLETGRIVTVFTNGQLVPVRRDLHAMPIQWVVTWHQDQIELSVFLKNIEPLRGKEKVSIQSIVNRDTHERSMGIIDKCFGGFDFRFRYADETKRTWDLWGIPDSEIKCPASEFMTLIEEDGSAYPCNSKWWGPIGSIYDPYSYDQEKAVSLDEHASHCMKDHRCGAHLSARLMECI